MQTEEVVCLKRGVALTPVGLDPRKPEHVLGWNVKLLGYRRRSRLVGVNKAHSLFGTTARAFVYGRRVACVPSAIITAASTEKKFQGVTQRGTDPLALPPPNTNLTTPEC